MKIEEILRHLKTNISDRNEGGLTKFILVGSRVLDLEKDNSDIDVIVIISDSIDTYDFIKEAAIVISDIFSLYETVVGIYPIKESNYHMGNSQFINNIITKGVEF